MGVVDLRWLLFLFLLAPFSGCLSAPGADPDLTGADPWRPVDEARLTPGGVAASEVAIAADPTDPAHLVASANSQGGFGVYETFDAGGNWSASHYAARDVDPLGVRFRGLSDPVVAFGPEGTLYLAGLAYLPSSAVFVARSPTGETREWETIVVHESDLASSFNDKEWLAVDPVTGTLVLSWQKEPAMDQLRGVESALGGRADIDLGDIVVVRSTDRGETWTEPMKVSRGLHNNGTQVGWTPNGDAHLIWVNYEEGSIDHVVSTDGGTTWSEPRAVGDVQIVPAFPRHARMHTLPALAVSPVSDALYVVWHDLRDGDADVYAVASGDNGKTWTPPTRVNQDAEGNGAIQFYPWAAVDAAGRLHVTFYDGRHDEHPRFTFYHAYAEGPALKFNETGAVSSESFTVFAAPDGGSGESRGIGDYTGLAVTSRGVFPVWADGRGEESAVFSVRLVPPRAG